jgi:hypothetical protein
MIVDGECEMLQTADGNKARNHHLYTPISSFIVVLSSTAPTLASEMSTGDAS